MAKLYILGNGFDLAHGLKTKYSDFGDWLLKKNFEAYILINFYSIIGVYSEKLEGNWGNIENALNLNYEELEKINDFFSKGSLLSISHQTYFMMSSIFDQIIRVFKDDFREWVEEIEKQINNKKSEIKKIFNFSKDDKFISFNYTSTLQTVYEIADANIRQIHGKISSRENIIFGTEKNNKSNVTNLNSYKHTYTSIFSKESKRIATNVIDNLLSDWCKNIEEVIIYGCTFGKENGDIEYFKGFCECECLKGKKIKLIYYCDESNPNDSQDEKDKSELVKSLDKNSKNIKPVSNIEFLSKQ